MRDEEKEFYLKNVIQVNRMISIIFFCFIFLPFSLLMGNVAHFWSIPISYLCFLQIIIVATYSVNLFIGRGLHLHKVYQFTGVISSCLLIGLISANGYVGIYISFGFFPFMAALYYNKNFTRFASAVSFASMIISMIYRTSVVSTVHPISGVPYSPAEFFWAYVPGFSIELFFAHLIAMAMTKRGARNLKMLFSLVAESNEMNLELTEKNIELENTQNKILLFLSKILGSHDLFTGNHVIHTKTYVGIISRELRSKGYYTDELTDETIATYEIAAVMHDIGKIHIPEGILNKIGKFTAEEFQIMKSHPEEGKKLLQYLPEMKNGNFNKIAEDMALYHHEKWDGSGYPKGISGKQIPLCARIMAAADVLDALISRRLYKEPMTIEQAMCVFRELKGIQFEPCISDAVLARKEDFVSFDMYFKQEEEQNNITELEWWKRYHEYQTKNKK